MNERRDDTTEPEVESPHRGRPGGYYYDDATGYEVYKPEDEGEEDGGPEGVFPHAAQDTSLRAPK